VFLEGLVVFGQTGCGEDSGVRRACVGEGEEDVDGPVITRDEVADDKA
jgi:hypothetical protein